MFTVTDGVEESLLGISKESLNGPDAVGANRTVTVQDPAGAIVLPEQLSAEMLNGGAKRSELATVPITRSAFPLLLTVTVWSEVLPSRTVPKDI
jgi:hypothetical protein